MMLSGHALAVALASGSFSLEGRGNRPRSL
jgi:hypothetical protein